MLHKHFWNLLFSKATIISAIRFLVLIQNQPNMDRWGKGKPAMICTIFLLISIAQVHPFNCSADGTADAQYILKVDWRRIN